MPLASATLFARLRWYAFVSSDTPFKVEAHGLHGLPPRGLIAVWKGCRRRNLAHAVRVIVLRPPPWCKGQPPHPPSDGEQHNERRSTPFPTAGIMSHEILAVYGWHKY